MLADEMSRRTARMAADLARRARKIEAMILDGASAQNSKEESRCPPCSLGQRCCDASFLTELKFESITLAAAASAVSSVLSSGSDATVCGLAGAGERCGAARPGRGRHSVDRCASVSPPRRPAEVRGRSVRRRHAWFGRGRRWRSGWCAGRGRRRVWCRGGPASLFLRCRRSMPLAGHAFGRREGQIDPVHAALGEAASGRTVGPPAIESGLGPAHHFAQYSCKNSLLLQSANVFDLIPLTEPDYRD
jgi:hypothetical protein